MEDNSELFSRIDDLIDRSDRNGILTLTHFLTPREQYVTENRLRGMHFERFVTGSGVENTERNIMVFFPEWMDASDVDMSSYITGIKVKVGFGEPGHRDYLGSIMGLGIKREWVGDILIEGDTGYIICLASVENTILDELTHIGRYGVRTEKTDLGRIPPRILNVKRKSFTVQSLRLDSIISSAFNVSRSNASAYIKEEMVSLNYEECTSQSKDIRQGDIISVRGLGKGIVAEIKGMSRKGRTIVDFDLYV